MTGDTSKTGDDISKPNLVYASHGRVIGVDIGDWSGFLAGPVLLEQDDESRIELRYNESSEGPRPEIGMIISVEYTGEHIHIIKQVKLLEGHISAAARLKNIPASNNLLRIPMPPAAKTIAYILFILGVVTVAYALFGDFYPHYARESIAITLALACVDFMICGGLWYYTNDT